MASNIAKKAFASAKAAKVKTDKITVNNNINLDETTESIASIAQQITNHKNITISVIDPTDDLGQNGDIWVKIPDVPPVTDYYFRFDASKLALEDLAKVTAWEDVSDNSIDLVQATEDNQPTFLETGFNGRPCVQFNTDKYLEKTSFSLDRNTGFTFFAVMQFDDLGSSQQVFAIGNEGTSASEANRLSLYKTSQHNLNTRINYTAAATIPAAEINLLPMLVSGRYDKVNHAIYKNGILKESVEYANNVSAPNKLTLGRSLFTSSIYHFKAKLAEFVCFTRPLSTEERTALEVYYMQKWGLV